MPLSLDIKQIAFCLAVEHDICHVFDLCSSFFGSIKLAHEICVNISFLINYFYCYCCEYCSYCAGKCSVWDIGLNRIRAAQGPYLTVQLFGAWSHQVQWCAASLLQPFSCEAVLWQSQPGPRHDSAAGCRPWSLRGVADSVWYARVLLLFSATPQTDTGSKTFECALVSTLETYDDPEHGNYCHYCTYWAKSTLFEFRTKSKALWRWPLCHEANQVIFFHERLWFM